jgi:hypothetical protein
MEAAEPALPCHLSRFMSTVEDLDVEAAPADVARGSKESLHAVVFTGLLLLHDETAAVDAVAPPSAFMSMVEL